MSSEYNWRWTCGYCGRSNRDRIPISHLTRHVAVTCRHCKAVQCSVPNCKTSPATGAYKKYWFRDAERLNQRIAAAKTMRRMIES